MESLPHQPFDFDAWMKLAREDTKAFERQRQQAIERLIAQVSPARRQRMRALQWRIEKERERCANPLGACVRVFNMMWERAYGANGLLDCLQTFSSRAPTAAARRPPVRLVHSDAATEGDRRTSIRRGRARRPPSNASS